MMIGPPLTYKSGAIFGRKTFSHLSTALMYPGGDVTSEHDMFRDIFQPHNVCVLDIYNLTEIYVL